MGACYVDNFIEDEDVPLTKSELLYAFTDAQEIDRYENGHCYSGGIGMADGLQIIREKKFGSFKEAEEWVIEHTRKWGPAVAVRVEGPNDKGWYYGAWCAE